MKYYNNKFSADIRLAKKLDLPLIFVDGISGIYQFYSQNDTEDILQMINQDILSILDEIETIKTSGKVAERGSVSDNINRRIRRPELDLLIHGLLYSYDFGVCLPEDNSGLDGRDRTKRIAGSRLLSADFRKQILDDAALIVDQIENWNG